MKGTITKMCIGLFLLNFKNIREDVSYHIPGTNQDPNYQPFHSESLTPWSRLCIWLYENFFSDISHLALAVFLVLFT